MRNQAGRHTQHRDKPERIISQSAIFSGSTQWTLNTKRIWAVYNSTLSFSCFYNPFIYILINYTQRLNLFAIIILFRFVSFMVLFLPSPSFTHNNPIITSPIQNPPIPHHTTHHWNNHQAHTYISFLLFIHIYENWNRTSILI